MKNVNKLKKKIAEAEAQDKEDDMSLGPIIDEKSSFMTKGVQTMLRLTSDNHVELSGMADGKANILISVNAIIISVILTVLLRRLQVDTYLTIPTIIFLAFSNCEIETALKSPFTSTSCATILFFPKAAPVVEFVSKLILYLSTLLFNYS